MKKVLAIVLALVLALSMMAVASAETTNPVAGKKVGDRVEFGGLLGHAPVMRVSPFSCADMIARGGRIPAPIHSFKN